MYLLDTNIWLERLLEQERSEEVGKFLGAIPSDEIFVTDFALHSVGLILTRLGEPEAFDAFLRDLFFSGSVGLIRLAPKDLPDVVAAIRHFSLDFDDGYQYVAARMRTLTIISFDADLDRTDLGRQHLLRHCRSGHKPDLGSHGSGRSPSLPRNHRVRVGAHNGCNVCRPCLPCAAGVAPSSTGGRRPSPSVSAKHEDH